MIRFLEEGWGKFLGNTVSLCFFWELLGRRTRVAGIAFWSTGKGSETFGVTVGLRKDACCRLSLSLRLWTKYCRPGNSRMLNISTFSFYSVRTTLGARRVRRFVWWSRDDYQRRSLRSWKSPGSAISATGSRWGEWRSTISECDRFSICFSFRTKRKRTQVSSKPSFEQRFEGRRRLLKINKTYKYFFFFFKKKGNKEVKEVNINL